MTYLELFLAFFRIGLFSIGGGYAALPLIQNEVTTVYGWMNQSEFADLVAISQLTPGPVAINAATFVGTRTAGLAGALIASFACILPSCAIVVILAVLYGKYKRLAYIQGVLGALRPAVAGLIAAAGFSVAGIFFCGAGSAVSIVVGAVIMTLSLVILRRWRINPALVILGSGVVGAVIYPML
ncbi:MAG: chromate transporter [Eubacteriales bacterium]